MADVMQYREVRQRFSVRDDDGPDSDLFPDKYTVTGTVEFTPKLPKGDVIAYPEEFVKPMPITGRIVAGELFANWVESDQEPTRPLFLPVTVDDNADQTWSWIMRVSSLLIDGQEASIKMGDREFQVEAGEGPLWLSTVAAVSKGSGAIIARGPRGYGITGITAESGVVTVEWEGGDNAIIPIPTAALATPTSDGLMPAADKAKLDGIATVPVRFDTTAGTAIYVHNGVRERRVSYDSGWRHVQHLLDTGDFELWGGTPTAAFSYFKMQREGDRVFVAGRIQPKESIVGTDRSVARPIFTGFPHGFSPQNTYQLVGDALMYSSGARTSIRNVNSTLEMFSGTGTWQAGELIMITVDWSTFSILPNALPGTPA